jgi:hypothetical protein
MRCRATLTLLALLLITTGIVAGIASARNGSGPDTALPRQVEVKIRFLRLEHRQNGTTREILLQAPTVRTMDNKRGQVGITGKDGPVTKQWMTDVLPRLNADGTISLRLEVKDADEGGPEETVRTVTATRRLLPDKTVRIDCFAAKGDTVVMDVTAAEVLDQSHTP